MEHLEKRWKALHSQQRQYLISFFQGVDIHVNLFEEQDHEKVACTFTLALNLTGVKQPSFGHVHQELNIPKDHRIGLLNQLKILDLTFYLQ